MLRDNQDDQAFVERLEALVHQETRERSESWVNEVETASQDHAEVSEHEDHPGRLVTQGDEERTVCQEMMGPRESRAHQEQLESPENQGNQEHVEPWDQLDHLDPRVISDLKDSKETEDPADVVVELVASEHREPRDLVEPRDPRVHPDFKECQASQEAQVPVGQSESLVNRDQWGPQEPMESSGPKETRANAEHLDAREPMVAQEQMDQMD